MTAIVCSLTDLATGARRGAAVVCLEARYASVAWVGAARMERRFGSPRAWLAIENELRLGLEAGQLERSSAIAALLLDDGGRSDLVLQYVMSLPIEVTPEQVAGALDEALKQARSGAPAQGRDAASMRENQRWE